MNAEDAQMLETRRQLSRLTPADWAAMNARVSQSIAEGWRDFDTLERLAAHAIGCSRFDLRDSELETVAHLVAARLRGDQ